MEDKGALQAAFDVIKKSPKVSCNFFGASRLFCTSHYFSYSSPRGCPLPPKHTNIGW